MPYRGKGVIKYNKKWNLTPRREAALKRLAELKVDVYSSINADDYTLLIPHHLDSPQYIEIGYLIAQLGNEQFPHYYDCLSSIETTVFKRERGDPIQVSFVDSHPHGLKYRVEPDDTNE